MQFTAGIWLVEWSQSVPCEGGGGGAQAFTNEAAALEYAKERQDDDTVVCIWNGIWSFDSMADQRLVRGAARVGFEEPCKYNEAILQCRQECDLKGLPWEAYRDSQGLEF